MPNKEVLVKVNYEKPLDESSTLSCTYYTDYTFIEVHSEDSISDVKGTWKVNEHGDVIWTMSCRDNWVHDRFSSEVMNAIIERELLNEE